MGLTKGQTLGRTKVLESLKRGKTFLLSGSAGVGKTFLVKDIIDRLDCEVTLTAPTHQACTVLSDKTNTHCKTIHSHLNLKLTRDGLGGYKLVRDSYGKSTPQKDTVIIVDEASMVSQQLLDFIETDMGYNTYLFIGDKKQLPPVNELHSPCFKQNYDGFELTEIVRQAKDNDNIILSRELNRLKDRKDGNFYKWLPNDCDDKKVKYVLDNNAKYITRTNKEVKKFNQLIRYNIWESPDDYMLGEKIMLKENYKRYVNSKEVTINKLDKSEYIMFIGALHIVVRYWIINDDICVVADSDMEKYIQMIEYARAEALGGNKKMWKVYYTWLEFFADVQHTHAMTVHRSQGSTFDNSIIDIGEIRKNKNKLEMVRMLYTAITRTANYNYLI